MHREQDLIVALFPCSSVDQDTSLRMPNKLRICNEGQAGNTKRQRRGLLVFSELSSLPSAGSRSGYFHTSLGCKPRSLIRVSLGWFGYSKNVRKDNPTPAYSPISDRRRLTALVEVHWARRLQEPMLRISGPSFKITIKACLDQLQGHPKVRLPLALVSSYIT
jgi:hypothetical protein